MYSIKLLIYSLSPIFSPRAAGNILQTLLAEGIASRGALQAAGDVSGDIFSQAYGQGLNALQGGLSLAPQTAGLGLLPSQIMSQVGAEQQNAPFNQLAQFQKLLGGPIVTGGGGTTARLGLASQIGLNFATGG